MRLYAHMLQILSATHLHFSEVYFSWSAYAKTIFLAISVSFEFLPLFPLPFLSPHATTCIHSYAHTHLHWVIIEHSFWRRRTTKMLVGRIKRKEMFTARWGQYKETVVRFDNTVLLVSYKPQQVGIDMLLRRWENILMNEAINFLALAGDVSADAHSSHLSTFLSLKTFLMIRIYSKGTQCSDPPTSFEGNSFPRIWSQLRWPLQCLCQSRKQKGSWAYSKSEALYKPENEKSDAWVIKCGTLCLWPVFFPQCSFTKDHWRVQGVRHSYTQAEQMLWFCLLSWSKYRIREINAIKE